VGLRASLGALEVMRLIHDTKSTKYTNLFVRLYSQTRSLDYLTNKSVHLVGLLS
jgi:hypothetical protein